MLEPLFNLAASSLPDLTLIYCGKSEFDYFVYSFLLNSTTICLKRAQKLTQTGLSLAMSGQARQAASERLSSRGFIDE
jgi:hypothetical protein